MAVSNETPVSHQRWMAIALDQARRGVGLTSPNPPVGAVIVSEGRIIGAGYHRKAGMPHAEIEAIKEARANFPKHLAGSTLFVTLEPCSTHGRTPPCTEAIRDSGIRQVFIGALDPNPKHAGRGIDVLRAHGIHATHGLLEAECRQLIRPFAKWITTGLPYVIAKVGQSLDGRITRPPGEPQWITHDAARAHARRLRTRVDAIIIGAETLRKDNPHLTLRDAATGSGKEQPWRVVLTRSGDLPAGAHVFTDEFKDRTLVLHGLTFPDVLKELARREIASVLVEGGGIILGQAFQTQAVDEAWWYIAPRLCGGGRPSIAGLPFAHSVQLTDVNILPLGDNVCISGVPAWPEPDAATPSAASHFEEAPSA